MMKRLLVILACLSLGISMSGCTSNDSKQDSEVTSDYDSSELEAVEGGEIAADSEMTGSTDQLPEQALGEVSPTETPSSDLAVDAPLDSTSTDSTSTDSAANSDSSSPLTEVPSSTETSYGDTAATDSSTTTDLLPPAPAEENTTVLDSAATDPEPAAKPALPPLQKVASTPWKVGKVLYNAVYFAKPGDSLESISQTIYGADKTAELKRGNPMFNSRGVKPGDKVYYNSPQRPDDDTKISVYYEDVGLPPQVYTAKAGDNIRQVSKELFGYEQAWKEVWASNAVDSKGALEEGTQLRYWPTGSAAANVATNTESQMPPANSEMAMNSPPAMDAPPQEAPPAEAQQAMNELPPPPPADMMQELPPPPPPPNDFAQNDMALPPPPPPAEMAPPPVANGRVDNGDQIQGMDSDTTMALAAVGLAAAGLAALIVIRKKRKQRELDQVMHDTQVGT